MTTADDDEQRELPAPTTRSAAAAVGECGAFGGRRAAEARRLGVRPSRLSALGGGAERIRNLAATWFFAAVHLLDVYHALERLASAGRQALGEGTALTAWLTSAGRNLVGDGYAGVGEALTRPLGDAEATGRLAAAGGVLNYFAGRRDRLGYVVRLRRGQALGFGRVLDRDGGRREPPWVRRPQRLLPNSNRQNREGRPRAARPGPAQPFQIFASPHEIAQAGRTRRISRWGGRRRTGRPGKLCGAAKSSAGRPEVPVRACR